MMEVIDTVGLLWTAMILAYGVIAVALVIGRWATCCRAGGTSAQRRSREIAIQIIASSSIAPVTDRTDRPNPRASTRTAGFRWLCVLPARTALKNELVKLGIPPSSTNEAVNELWERWDKREV
jgi:hypothetical protein